MYSFFQSLFSKSTVENRLLMSLLPLMFIMIVLDSLLNTWFLATSQSQIVLIAAKIILAIPILLLVIFSLSRILDHKLSKTRKALRPAN